jgi:hypothetical protein
MGGASFFNIGSGDSMQDAFDRLVREARHDHGHGGYTGTIAEKTAVRELDMPGHWLEHVDTRRLDEEQAEEFADACREVVPYDKWGPADGFEIKRAEDGTRRWAFFGDASE